MRLSPMKIFARAMMPFLLCPLCAFWSEPPFAGQSASGAYSQLDSSGHEEPAATPTNPGSRMEANRSQGTSQPGYASSEAVHYELARLMFDMGNADGALRAAEMGLRAAPDSARLFLTKSRAEEALGLWYRSRQTLQTALSSLDDLSLLRQYALVEDTFGPSSPKAYAALVFALKKVSPLPADFGVLLQRGFDVSLREGDLVKAGWFAEELKAAGRPEAAALLRSPQERAVNFATIPGGTKALARMVLNKEPTHSRRLLAEYSLALVHRSSSSSDKSLDPDSISGYFKSIRALQNYGRRNGRSVTIEISTATRDSRRAGEKILGLLGLQLLSEPENPTIAVAEIRGAAVRQIAATALGIDPASVQSGLRSNGSFRFEIVDDRVPIQFGEAAWKRQFYPRVDYAGGIAEAIAIYPSMAKVYIGLDHMGDHAASALVAGTDLKTLAEKHADLLMRYSSAFAVDGERAYVPGGRDAEPFWESLVHARAAEPAKFFSALLQRDDGRLLAYFHALAQLDLRHQEFFARTPSRLSKFYGLFASSAEMRLGARRGSIDSPFGSFLAELPIDDSGHVTFPGGPGIWMVARGDDASVENIARLRKALGRTSPAADEDEIILRLARTSYRMSDGDHSELSNFLGVARLEARRSHPLDEGAALLLAQAYEEHKNIWPYFSSIPGLEHPDFDRFLTLSEKLHRLSRPQRNRAWGEIHSLLALLCRARQTSALGDRECAALFGDICRRFALAVSEGDFSAASLDIVRSIIAQSSSLAGAPDPDRSVMEILFRPGTKQSEMEFRGKQHTFDTAKSCREKYGRVLELQSVPRLATLYRLYDAAASFSTESAQSRDQIDAIDAALKSMPEVELPGKLRLNREAVSVLESFRLREARESAALLRRLSSQREFSKAEARRLVSELLGKIGPQVQLALSGIIYALYLSPSDLLVSEDPLLLRKHAFVRFSDDGGHGGDLPPTSLVQAENTETHLLGGFADPAEMAGLIAAAGTEKADEKCLPFMSAQIGFIRSIPWSGLRDQDLRLVGLGVRTAREWIVYSAISAAHRADLAGVTLGLLSLSRRSNLLRAIDSRDWPAVWESVTLSELFVLGNEYIVRHPSDAWYSPTIRAFRSLAAGNTRSRPRNPGLGLTPQFDLGRPAFPHAEPYERYEGLQTPESLAARTSELALYLAEFLDRESLPAAVLGEIAETMAMGIFRAIHLSDFHDWRSVNAAYASLSDDSVHEALERQ